MGAPDIELARAFDDAAEVACGQSCCRDNRRKARSPRGRATALSSDRGFASDRKPGTASEGPLPRLGAPLPRLPYKSQRTDNNKGSIIARSEEYKVDS